MMLKMVDITIEASNPSFLLGKISNGKSGLKLTYLKIKQNQYQN